MKILMPLSVLIFLNVFGRDNIPESMGSSVETMNQIVHEREPDEPAPLNLQDEEQREFQEQQELEQKIWEAQKKQDEYRYNVY